MKVIQFSSVQSLSLVRLFATSWTAARQASLSLPEFIQTLAHWVSDAIQPSHPVIPFYSHFQSFPASGSFQMVQFCTSGGQSIGVSASASVLPMSIQNWFPSRLSSWIPCNPRDSQESFPTSQFKSINSSALSFLYGLNFPSIHDYWKNHSFD